MVICIVCYDVYIQLGQKIYLKKKKVKIGMPEVTTPTFIHS